MKIKLHFDKLYCNERKNEPCSVAIPFAEGVLPEHNIEKFNVCSQNGNVMLTQVKATSFWKDGTVRWLFVRFLADLPANAPIDYYFTDEGFGEVCGFDVLKNPEDIFENCLGFTKEAFLPVLKTEGKEAVTEVKAWELLENGPVCRAVKGIGVHHINERNITFDIRIKAFYNTEYLECAYRIINTSEEELALEELFFEFTDDFGQAETCVAGSNYKTKFKISETGEELHELVEAEKLLYEANEQFAEVLYGTFFAAVAGEKGSLAGTIYQAQQNYPKAVTASNAGVRLHIVPADSVTKIILQPGMAREQRFMLHRGAANTDFKEFNDRSLIYQMPDRPILEACVYEKSGVFENVFINNKNCDYEAALIGKADSHARCYGMLNWGDTPDQGYTDQGRGGGKAVWSNNEYDFPHACTLLYIRTGVRRFLDYMLVSAWHWKDVDICHYSDNPNKVGGQYEHTNGHVINGKMACSHEWVEGLLDYYHFTGDKDALDIAIGIGNNVLKLLEGHKNKAEGESSARETGWALRSLTALYKETHDEKWLSECEWIVDNFENWMNKYGCMLAAYTSNTYIRVPFMISVAVGSLMRYYRVKPSERVKNIITASVEDMVNNCILETGYFYYKELPSLQRTGNNPLVLEALEYAYELTGDEKYIKAGLKTFEACMRKSDGGGSGKRIVADALISGNGSTKEFGKGLLPLVIFYKAVSERGLI